MKKKLTALFLSLLMSVQMIPLFALAEEAETPAESIISLELPEHIALQEETASAQADLTEADNQYAAYSFNETTQKLTMTLCDIPSATTITGTTTVWETGWYIADGTVELSSARVGGDVKLILKDGCKLTVGGITVTESDSLTIYAQKNGTGELISAASANNYAGIGGGSKEDGGIITIHGGKITATGGEMAAGIGGGSQGACGTVTIYGGEVTAAGGFNGAGIGTGSAPKNSGGSIAVYGGTVTVSTTDNSAMGDQRPRAIGGGFNGSVDTISINSEMEVKDGSGNAVTLNGTWAETLTGCAYTFRLPPPVVDYIDFFNETAYCDTYTDVTRNTANWTDGWYVVNEDVKIPGDVTVSGSVNLILSDGKTLTVDGKISGSGTFVVYARSDGENRGSLIVKQGIESENDIMIRGGNVVATGGDYGIYSDTIIEIICGDVTVQGEVKAISCNVFYIGSASRGVMRVFDRANEDVKSSGYWIRPDELTDKYYRIIEEAYVIDYRCYDEASGAFKEKACLEYSVIDENHKPAEWENDKWYAVKGDVTIEEGVDVSGSAHLILMNDSVLTVRDGITVRDPFSLGIYAQPGSSGELRAGNSENGTQYAGIGGSVEIHGGTVTAQSREGAGIGGGTVNIFGGTVTAQSREGAGIGGGTVNVFDGDVTAKSDNGAGIGASDVTLGEYITVYDSGANAVVLPDGGYWRDVLNGMAYVRILSDSAVSYLVYDEESGEFKTEFCVDYEEIVVSALSVLEDGKCYVVRGSPIVDNASVNVSGNVRLILTDGSDLTLNGDVHNGTLSTVYGDGHLSVYSQSTGDRAGRLTCCGANGDDDLSNGTNAIAVQHLTVNGGIVTVIGGNGGVFDIPLLITSGGSGISVTTLTVNGGSITAVGGSGINGTNGTVSVNDGGYGGNAAAGISAAALTVNGGSITAAGGSGGNGGMGQNTHLYNGNGGHGGTGGYAAAGISVTTLTVNGGSITAAGGAGGVGGKGGRGGLNDGTKDGTDGLSRADSAGITFGENSTIKGIVSVKANEADAFVPLPDGKTVSNYRYVKITDTIAYDAPVMLPKTSIRVTGTPGLRFAAYVTDAQREASSSYGFLVARENDDLAENPDHLVFNDAGSAAGTNAFGVTYTSGEAYNKTAGIDKTYADDGTEFGLSDVEATFFTGVMQGIPKAFYAENLIARPYMVVSGVTLYGETYAKSLYTNACAIRDGGYQGLDEDGIKYIGSIISAVDKEADIDVGGLTK